MNIKFSFFFYKGTNNALNDLETVEQDKHETSEMVASRNMTLMVLITMCLSVIFLLPRNVYFIYKYLIVTKTVFIFSYITVILYNLSNGLYIFIYFSFNKLFRQILIKYFKTFLCRFKSNK